MRQRLIGSQGSASFGLPSCLSGPSASLLPKVTSGKTQGKLSPKSLSVWKKNVCPAPREVCDVQKSACYPKNTSVYYSQGH